MLEFNRGDEDWRDVLNDNHRNGIRANLLGARENIDTAKWLRACAEGQFVGQCRRCGGYLIPLRPQERSGRTDYEAQCRTCHAPVLAPGGRVGKRGGE